MCVWTSFDSQLIIDILDILSVNTRNDEPSESRLSKEVCSSMSGLRLLFRDKYLAYQLLMSPAGVPKDHLSTIASSGLCFLLTWDRSNSAPVFGVHDRELPANRKKWMDWAMSQIMLMCPTQEQVQAMGAPARRFREAVLQGLRIVKITPESIHWTLDGVEMDVSGYRLQKHYENEISTQAAPLRTLPGPVDGNMGDKLSQDEPDTTGHEDLVSRPRQQTPYHESQRSENHGESAALPQQGREIAQQEQNPRQELPSGRRGEGNTRQRAPQRTVTPGLEQEDAPNTGHEGSPSNQLTEAVDDLKEVVTRHTGIFPKLEDMMRIDKKTTRGEGEKSEEREGAVIEKAVRKAIKKAMRKAEKRKSKVGVRKESRARRGYRSSQGSNN